MPVRSQAPLSATHRILKGSSCAHSHTGGAAELIRSLLGLALVAVVAVMSSSSAFFGGIPINCDAVLLRGGGGVGGTLGTDFARTGGGGVGTGGLLSPVACVNDGRFVVHFVASVV